MYVVRLVLVHARGETSRPSAHRMLTKDTYALRRQASTTYRTRKSEKVGRSVLNCELFGGWFAFRLVGLRALKLAPSSSFGWAVWAAVADERLYRLYCLGR